MQRTSKSTILDETIPVPRLANQNTREQDNQMGTAVLYSLLSQPPKSHSKHSATDNKAIEEISRHTANLHHLADEAISKISEFTTNLRKLASRNTRSPRALKSSRIWRPSTPWSFHQNRWRNTAFWVTQPEINAEDKRPSRIPEQSRSYFWRTSIHSKRRTVNWERKSNK